MNVEDRRILMQAMHALSDARRLWPARHPASGMIMGIDEDCRQVYELITTTRDDILNHIAKQSGQPEEPLCSKDTLT